MRILGYNILKGGTGREALIAEVIRAADADVVMLEEATRLSSLADIARQAGYAYYDARPNTSTGFMSRIPVQHRWHEFAYTRSPFLEVIPEDHNLHIYGVHLISGLVIPAEWLRRREIHKLLQAVNRAVPHIMIGDFNTLAPDDTFDRAAMPRWLQMLLLTGGGDIPRMALRRVLEAGYTDAFRRCHPHENGWSLPAWQPNTRLDYAFVSPHLKENIADCRLLTELKTVQQASDHLPLLLEMELLDRL